MLMTHFSTCVTSDFCGLFMFLQIQLHANLFQFGIFMSGFQFVGLVVENQPDATETLRYYGFFTLCIGFFLSMFSALISFIAMEYFNGIKNEDPEFIVLGVLKFKGFFRVLLSSRIPSHFKRSTSTSQPWFWSRLHLVLNQNILSR